MVAAAAVPATRVNARVTPAANSSPRCRRRLETTMNGLLVLLVRQHGYTNRRMSIRLRRARFHYTFWAGDLRRDRDLRIDNGRLTWLKRRLNVGGSKRHTSYAATLCRSRRDDPRPEEMPVPSTLRRKVLAG